MVYRLGHVAELRNLPATTLAAWQWLHEQLYLLDEQYGVERNSMEDDGGYVLFMEKGTAWSELQRYGDFDGKLSESIEQRGDWCSILYLMNNEFSINIVMAVDDLPIVLKKELEA